MRVSGSRLCCAASRASASSLAARIADRVRTGSADRTVLLVEALPGGCYTIEMLVSPALPLPAVSPPSQRHALSVSSAGMLSTLHHTVDVVFTNIVGDVNAVGGSEV